MQGGTFRIEELEKILVDVGPERICLMTALRDVRMNCAGMRRLLLPGKRVAVEVRKLGQQGDAGRLQRNTRAVADLPETVEPELFAFGGAAEIREYGSGFVRPLGVGKWPLVEGIVGADFLPFFIGVVAWGVFTGNYIRQSQIPRRPNAILQTTARFLMPGRRFNRVDTFAPAAQPSSCNPFLLLHTTFAELFSIYSTLFTSCR